MKYEIGARIRKYREMRGFSQKELAQKIGVSNSRVSNWEQGNYGLSHQTRPPESCKHSFGFRIMTCFHLKMLILSRG